MMPLQEDSMTHSLKSAVLLVLGLVLAGPAGAQESKAAATTRKNLLQKVTIEAKEVGLKNFLEGDLIADLDKPLRFKIDNASGVSNNMKVSYVGKEVRVEQVLNDLADKYDFGYFVMSNASNNKEDGKVVIRKSSKGKERGYEAGKAPKKTGSLPREARTVASRPQPAVFGNVFQPARGSLASWNLAATLL
jgi:hypothetical protein